MNILPSDLNIALIHYWLINNRGGEAVLEAIGRILPRANLYTNVLDRKYLFGSLEGMPVTTTFIDKLPAARKAYQAYVGLMPMALEALDMSPYDLIISSEAGPAKWVLPSPGKVHLCYCHSPMRYLWDQRFTYYEQIPPWLRPLAPFVAHGLRQSDVLSSFRVTQFIANSNFVAKRINQFYRREAEVIHPPVDVARFIADTPEDFYLCAGEIRHYKRIDLAILACQRLGRRIIIVGDGRLGPLESLAGPNVTFLGRVDTRTFKCLLARCRALLFPGVEDFGIVPVEAMASGRPVIAYGQGGALDSVDPGVSGVFFEEQSVDSLCDAILEFERIESRFSAERCQAWAKQFDRNVFESKFKNAIGRALIAAPETS
jgi:glycosyltransferase involved in cell wall biosynthesis